MAAHDAGQVRPAQERAQRAEQPGGLDGVEGEHLRRAGEPFGQVEDYINEAGPLAELERAALWLLAWSMREASAQRQDH